MPERIANKFILAEDVEQQNLVRRYLERCGHGSGLRLVPLSAKGLGGSGEKYVRDHYPQQVQACRSSLGRRAPALLIVIVDADTETTQHRATQLSDALKAADMHERDDGEPIVVLIPNATSRHGFALCWGTKWTKKQTTRSLSPLRPRSAKLQKRCINGRGLGLPQVQRLHPH